MEKSKDINTRIKRNFLKGVEKPHIVSQPVIHKEEDKYYLAFFASFFDKKDMESGKCERPTLWALADIETGEIIEKYETKEKEFSEASYEDKYVIRASKPYDTSLVYYDRAFGILDTIREKLIIDNKLYDKEYKLYLKMILANVSDDFHKFYRDLSV